MALLPIEISPRGMRLIRFTFNEGRLRVKKKKTGVFCASLKLTRYSYSVTPPYRITRFALFTNFLFSVSFFSFSYFLSHISDIATKFTRRILARLSLLSFDARFDAARLHTAASNSRKTNYKWRMDTRLHDSRDRLVTGLPSPSGHSRFDLRSSVVICDMWILVSRATRTLAYIACSCDHNLVC